MNGSVCAGYEDIPNASQPCEGDSGGPLFDASAVYALVSRGDAQFGCGGSLRPTMFAPLWRARGFELLTTGELPPPPTVRSAAVSPPPPHAAPPAWEPATKLRGPFAGPYGSWACRARSRWMTAASAATALALALTL